MANISRLWICVCVFEQMTSAEGSKQATQFCWMVAWTQHDTVKNTSANWVELL